MQWNTHKTDLISEAVIKLHLLGNSLISYDTIDTSIPFLWFSWFSSSLLSCLYTHRHRHTHTHTIYYHIVYLQCLLLSISPCPSVNSIKARITVLFTDVFQVPGRHSKQLAWSKPALYTLLNSYISLWKASVFSYQL